jgi:hypothetical protein
MKTIESKKEVSRVAGDLGVANKFAFIDYRSDSSVRFISVVCMSFAAGIAFPERSDV